MQSNEYNIINLLPLSVMIVARISIRVARSMRVRTYHSAPRFTQTESYSTPALVVLADG